ncbi:MAG: SMP-30/gluconolactonase/LRE family protein [Gammaproteobacteria bacterium]
MKRILAGCACLLLIAIGVDAGAVRADDDLVVDRNAAHRFATLPAGVRFPEGITADPKTGDVFVGTFDAPSPTNPNPENRLLRFDRQGRLEASRSFGTTPLLGLEFNGADGKVYIAAVGDFSGTGSRIQRIAANFNGATAIEEVAVIPSIGAPAPRTVPNPDGSVDTITFGDNARVPNALTFDSQGRLYISDSFQGAIFRIDNPVACAPCGVTDVTMVAHDPLLATAGFPPFGANGLAFNKDESALFIANTGDDRVLRLNMGTGEVTVFAESINGADGLAFDKGSGLLWVCANQADEVVALNAKGRVVAKLGEFLGVRSDGTVRGLLFPASLVIVDDEMFVTNLALPLDGVAGNEPEEDVKRYTISRMKLPHH